MAEVVYENLYTLRVTLTIPEQLALERIAAYREVSATDVVRDLLKGCVSQCKEWDSEERT